MRTGFDGRQYVGIDQLSISESCLRNWLAQADAVSWSSTKRRVYSAALQRWHRFAKGDPLPKTRLTSEPTIRAEPAARSLVGSVRGWRAWSAFAEHARPGG
jgi:hypothetical protein